MHSKPIGTYRNVFSCDTTAKAGDEMPGDRTDNTSAVPAQLSRVRIARDSATAVSSRNLCCKSDRCSVRGPTESHA